MKPPIPTEEEECVTLTQYLELLKVQGKVVMFAHIVNELSINRRVGQKPNFNFLRKRKASGWRPGVPDYIIITKKDVLFIEMKRSKSSPSATKPSQVEWMNAINDTGGNAVICKGFDEAKKYLEEKL